MIEPDGVLDGDYGETVAVWFGVGHGQSDYPDPIKATQPFEIRGQIGRANVSFAFRYARTRSRKWRLKQRSSP